MASHISGHACFIGAKGNAPGSRNGKGLGVIDTTPRTGTTQLPFQRDVSVFSNPIVPWSKPKCWSNKCCKKGKYACYANKYYKAVPRKKWNNGCGATLFNMNIWARDKKPKSWAKAKYSNARKNVWWYQQRAPKAAMVDIPKEIGQLIRSNRLPTATAGGHLKLTLFQVNADGGGPYKCKLDMGGNAQGWDGWLPVKGQIPGNKSGYKPSFNKYSKKRWNMVVKLPKNLNCKGTYSGVSNVCIVRCENKAKNGPFGGCIAFQQWKPQKPTPIPEPPIIDNGYETEPSVPDNQNDYTEYNDDPQTVDTSKNGEADLYKRALNGTMEDDSDDSLDIDGDDQDDNGESEDPDSEDAGDPESEEEPDDSSDGDDGVPVGKLQFN
ncbi:hypothetical protein H072_7640 [Dactylellina haptotyla CBS 200.50]|uniref:Uncharacterized protein n=1 Tax=Dactylellina haptotyla (strain CBS 200.50) TaxID=1284197 RepID=S8A6K5_DACHA|nr:hypothetical protein H072_7640 [Dactylellina haptotyla CBS 200.50]